MKMVLTTADTPDAYLLALDGWQRRYADALHAVVREACPEAEVQLKWGHLVWFLQGPMLLVRAEPQRVLFGFWRGQRLRHIETRLRPGGKYEMATLELLRDTPLERSVAVQLVEEAASLQRRLGDPTAVARGGGA